MTSKTCEGKMNVIDIYALHIDIYMLCIFLGSICFDFLLESLFAWNMTWIDAGV